MGTILTDLDDTVLNFGDRFQRWAEDRGLPTMGRLRDLFFVEAHLGCTTREAIRLIEAFTSEAGIDHEAEPCARVVLPRLRRRGYRFIGISACGPCPEYRQRRLDNLLGAFGFRFDGLICLPLGGSKDAVLRRYPPAVWIEDNPGHAEAGAKAGHRTFLIDRAYNRHAPPVQGVQRVTSWIEIEAALPAAIAA